MTTFLVHNIQSHKITKFKVHQVIIISQQQQRLLMPQLHLIWLSNLVFNNLLKINISNHLVLLLLLHTVNNKTNNNNNQNKLKILIMAYL